MRSTGVGRPEVPIPRIHRPPPVRAEVLPNGVRLLHQSLPGRGMAAVHVMLADGGRAEPERYDGLANVVASACAMSGSARAGDAFIEHLERLGVALSGGADHDGAYLTAMVPAERIAEVIGPVADAVLAPALRAEDVRHVVARRLAALRTERLHPRYRAHDAVRRLSYAPGSPYGRTARGNEESIGAIDAATVAGFHRRWYGPASARVLVVCDPDRWDDTLRAAEAFAGWSNDVAPSVPPRIYPARSAGWEIHPAPGTNQAMLTLGAVVVTDCRRTLSSVEVAINALAGWSGARLYHVLREGLGATYGLYSEFVARRVQSVLSGEFRIYGSIETARLDDAMARLRRELATVADGDLGADAVLRSRANIAGREAMLTQTVRSVVDVAGARFRRGFAADEQAERVDDLMSVTPSGAALDAARFLALGRLQLAVVGEPSACERAVAPLADEAGVPLIVVPPGG